MAFLSPLVESFGGGTVENWNGWSGRSLGRVGSCPVINVIRWMEELASFILGRNRGSVDLRGEIRTRRPM